MARVYDPHRGYILKKTYIDGVNKGEVFYYDKKGYVVKAEDLDKPFKADSVYFRQDNCYRRGKQNESRHNYVNDVKELANKAKGKEIYQTSHVRYETIKVKVE